MRITTPVITVAAVLLLAGCSGASGGSNTASNADNDAASSPAAAAPAGASVTYDVTSDGATANSITYLTFNNGSSGQEQANGATLPFSKTIELEDDNLFETSIFSLVAQAGEGATTISCKITANGEVIAEQTSTGQYAVVTCNGSSK